MKSLAKSTATVIAVLLLLLALLVNVVFMAGSLRQEKLYDFGSFIASGQEARRGQNPYSPENALVFELSFEQMGIESKLPNANPPISVPFFELIASQPPLRTLNLWRVISGVLYLVSITLLLLNDRFRVPPLRVFWAICLAGFWHTLQLGQIYALLLLLITLIWICLEKQWHLPASLLMGLLMAIKPNLILWPIFLGLAGNWSVLLIAATTAGLLSLFPVIIYGPLIYLQWIAVSNQFSALAFPGNNSLPGLFVRFGSAAIGYAISLALLGFLLYWLRRGQHSLQTIGGVGLVASLLVAPLAWTGYTIFLLPYLLTKREWRGADLFCAAILATPLLFVLSAFEASTISFIVIGWLYGWGLLVLLGGLLWEEGREPGNPGPRPRPAGAS